MSGINPKIIFATIQIATEFSDDIGNRRGGAGTGFFLRNGGGKPEFVTNRHNVDPTLRLGPKWTLSNAKLLLRRYVQLEPTEETRWIDLDLQRSHWAHSRRADVSVMKSGQFREALGEFGFNVMNVDLATQEFYEGKTQIMDLVSFVGYPGNNGQPWWDQRWNTPIARMATIASSPAIAFTNDSISTDDVTLVSGFSFSGSSGSPVLLHQKGLPPCGDLIDPNYTPATLLGIMSGHWWSASDEPAMFRHSGLSYFTRASSIACLLASAN